MRGCPFGHPLSFFCQRAIEWSDGAPIVSEGLGCGFKMAYYDE